MSIQTVGKTGAGNHALVGDFRSIQGETVDPQPVSSSYNAVAAAARDRSCSQGLVGPDFQQGGAFISPHVLEYNPKNSTFISNPKDQSQQVQQAFYRTEKEVHRLNTEMHRNYLSSSDENLLECASQRQHQGDPSCSSPEMYLICTSKERSETTYSSESQGSSSGLNEAEHVSQSSSSILASSPIAVESHWSSELSNANKSKFSAPFSPEEEPSFMGDFGSNFDEYKREVTFNQMSFPTTSDGVSKKISKMKPIPPPKRRESSDQNAASSPSSTSHSHSVSPTSGSSGNPSPQRSQATPLFPSLSSRQYTGELLASQRSKGISFLDCKAGEESGRFSVDYLGAKEVDRYVKSINSITKQLMVEQHPRDMVVYVSSEKIRLAPPNSATLYQSFAVKDVMWVRKCSKNKHIIGIVMWKSVAMRPSCHIIRCRDNVMAKTLFDILWEQTQKVDEISSTQKNSQSSFVLRPVSINSTSSEEGSMTPTPTTSVTEILHRFPALYIGSTATVKSNNIDDVIGKVLHECKPSTAKSVMMALSLSEVQLFESKNSSGDQEEKILSHETSRVRLMGVFSEDRRFSGYVIKEVGKPQEGHVIRCNSAALMTAFTSFLRQSCQLTSPQRGGSFYDEISTDESDEWDCSAEHHSSGTTASSGFVNRIKSLTCSIAQLSSSQTSTLSSSLTMPYPTFQSHLLESSTTQSPPSLPTQTVSSATGNTSYIGSGAIQSPFEFSDEEYAKFQVTYLGSATQDHVLSQHSVEDALYQFSKDGMSAGQAAVTKNTVSLQVSSLGINLTDKSKKLFVHRNYPLKTIIGFCQHYSDNKHFAFATERPGFANVKKVHVFRCLVERPEQVLAAMKYWLQLEPIISDPICSFQDSEQS